MTKAVIRVSFLTLIGAFIITSCYSENYEDLYGPRDPECDSVLTTYTAGIRPWIDAECVDCHNSGASSGGLDLSTYQDVFDNANVVLDRIKREPNDPKMMPLGQPKLPRCTIQGFEKWIAAGKPEN
ncbi:hypothetical protein [Phaeocystidibacter luteus]|uniref:Cytochrome c domain-containing protein n=1 Tax=Phaeocystidibacter luteus TaxID=911197 RepID=A0A6N6RDJ1_9FLAO|nr:hypothetical protein [Phaeocystidibacter luteus]KAB2807296.1 hypothetical protein F8C67_12005 [Phaeocystidibacter luteus]